MTEKTCKNCIHASEPYVMGEHEVVNCRIAPVTIGGFPIVSADEKCSECITDESEMPKQPTPDQQPQNLSDYINYKNEDGTVTTMYIPLVLGQLYNKVKVLEQEVEYLKRKR